MIYVNGKQTAVIGLGRSGFSAARLLSVHGAQVVILDDKTPEKLAAYIEKAKDLPHTQLRLGGIDASAVLNSDLVVTSPGVPFHHPALDGAREKGIPVIGEMELAFGYCPAPVAAITGTNGKTTTTTLANAMIQAGGKKSIACGNIGKAFSEAVFELSSDNWAVLEVSSFQLETIETFRPKVAAILNVTPDHLDRHEGMQDYVETKGRIFENQQAGDAAVLNTSDKYTPIYSSLVKGQLYLFGFPTGGRGAQKPGCFVAGDKIELLGRNLIAASELRIPGPHNLENACAAALMASLCGVPDAAIAKTLAEFTGVEHRLEAAGEINGIRFVNDSKGTNVDSVLKALESFEKPIVLMLGGRDKAGDFTRLAPLVKEKVTRIVAFGECKAKVVQQLAGAATVVEAGSLEEAVSGAFAASERGGVVLFSPGCASFDMFQNYEDRGRQFKAVVEKLRRQKAGKVNV
ncbi:MAG TPA: UDP-N-acetylmuramoyl-L-alanine--D-glutamate ligase [bacterium]|nr:UDP-N-acetylmuramoyl-L-alanine--D-glutamate ligase [bacterium]